ncbi:MAG: hypothetical protein C0505_00615 [Leptothrix sp. (in: Bacteria)]|nr:hypothetical protein [Leptothrix sp. (in: b-proteobacteria)]
MSATPAARPSRRGPLGLALAAGTAPLFARHARTADAPRFALGVAAGPPRAHGVVLRTLLTGADLPAQAPVQWEGADDEACTRVVARSAETAVGDDAHSAHAEPTGLQPGHWYFHRFATLGQRRTTGRTRTAPAPDAAVSRLDLVVFLGDCIDENGHDSASPDAPRRHEDGKLRLQGRRDWGRLARFHPLDDHRYRDPQAGPRPGRGRSNTVTLQDCPARPDPRRARPGAARGRCLVEAGRRGPQRLG